MLQQSIKISSLKNNSGQIPGLPKNPRFIKDEKYKKLVQSIKDDPEMLELREIIAYDNDGELIVICGNMRLKALKELGIKETPVKILPKDTSVEKLKAYTIKDNVPFGEHDFEALANEWDAEQLDEWGLDIDFKQEPEAEEDNYEIPEEIKTDFVLGDLIEIGDHRLLCGDSTDSDQVAKLMNGEKADMVFTDPPYGMNLDTDYSKMPRGENKYSKVIGDDKDFNANTIFLIEAKRYCIWGADWFYKSMPEGFSPIVWDKQPYETEAGPQNHFELCWVYPKEKRRIIRKLWTGFTAKEKNEKRVHPTQKPISLCIDIIDSKDGNLIIDPFLGSGSTMVAAHQLNRKCYGMELDPKYCQFIVDRMVKLDPSLVVKVNGQDYKSGN